MNKPRIDELNIARAFAILSVLVIHTTAPGTLFGSEQSSTRILLTWINNFQVFAVPVFLFISGLVLFYSYEHKWKKGQSITFYKKRMKGVILPYLIWSFIYYVFNKLNTQEIPFDDASAILNHLIYGNASYHLYYLVIIFQFYIIFPIAMFILSKFINSKKWLFLFPILFHMFFMYYQFDIYYIKETYILCFNYFIFFFTGGIAGIYYHNIKHYIYKYCPLLTVLAVIIGILKIKMSVHISNLYIADILYRTYCLLAAVSLIGISIFIKKKIGSMYNILSSIGIASFGIYLCHPMFQTLYNSIWSAPTNPSIYLIYTLCEFFTLLLLSWTVTRTYQISRDKLPVHFKKQLERRKLHS